MPETDRTDIVQALLPGLPGLTQISTERAAGRHDEDQPRHAADAVARTASACSPATRAGFPNGRRLTDDVTDIELRVVGGFLKGNKCPLGDGVDQNDMPFRTTFPYVAAPHSGLRLAAEAHRADPRTQHPGRSPYGPGPTAS